MDNDPGQACRHILVVEDDHTIGSLLSDALRGEGYEITLVRTAEEAFRLAQAQPWDLFLIDSFDPSYQQPTEALTSLIRELTAHALVIVATARS